MAKPKIAQNDQQMLADERRFLEYAWNYGTRAHALVADALADRLAATDDPAERHGLTARLFSEYAGSLETLGAWAWSLRERFAYGRFFHAYLCYRNSDIESFFKLVVKDETELVELLHLPPAEMLADEAQKRVSQPRQPFLDTVSSTYAHLKQAADLSVTDERVIVHAYNKTKHGLPMLPSLTDETRFEVPIPHKQREWAIASFPTEPEHIDELHGSIRAAAGWIGEIAAMTRVLSEAELLYVPVLVDGKFLTVPGEVS